MGELCSGELCLFAWISLPFLVFQIPTIWLPIGFLQGFIRVNYVCTNYSLHTTNSFARGEGIRMSGITSTPRIRGAWISRMSRNGHPIAMYKPIKLKKMKKTKISVTMRNGLVVTSYYYPLFATLQDAVCNIVTNMGYSPNDVVLVK